MGVRPGTPAGDVAGSGSDRGAVANGPGVAGVRGGPPC